MRQYRIKKSYGDVYYVQHKRLFIWMNVKRLESFYDSVFDAPVKFYLYEEAKSYIENQLKQEEENRKLNAAIKAYVVKYFYPPLPDKEPE